MRTEEILSYMERIERKKKLKKLVWRIKREFLRLLSQVLGTSLFVFIMIPLMEYDRARTVIVCEVAVCLIFSAWLGNRIYGTKRSTRREK